MAERAYITDSPEVLREFYDLFLLEDKLKELKGRLRKCYSFSNDYTPGEALHYEQEVLKVIKEGKDLIRVVSN